MYFNLLKFCNHSKVEVVHPDWDSWVYIVSFIVLLQNIKIFVVFVQWLVLSTKWFSHFKICVCLSGNCFQYVDFQECLILILTGARDTQSKAQDYKLTIEVLWVVLTVSSFIKSENDKEIQWFIKILNF